MTPMEPATINMPVLALRGLTVFPHMNLTFDVERPISIAALERAMEGEQDVFLVTQREIGVEQPEEKDLYQIGDGGGPEAGPPPAVVAVLTLPAGQY